MYHRRVSLTSSAAGLLFCFLFKEKENVILEQPERAESVERTIESKQKDFYAINILKYRIFIKYFLIMCKQSLSGADSSALRGQHGAARPQSDRHFNVPLKQTRSQVRHHTYQNQSQV